MKVLTRSREVGIGYGGSRGLIQIKLPSGKRENVEGRAGGLLAKVLLKYTPPAECRIGEKTPWLEAEIPDQLGNWLELRTTVTPLIPGTKATIEYVEYVKVETTYSTNAKYRSGHVCEALNYFDRIVRSHMAKRIKGR